MRSSIQSNKLNKAPRHLLFVFVADAHLITLTSVVLVCIKGIKLILSQASILYHDTVVKYESSCIIDTNINTKLNLDIINMCTRLTAYVNNMYPSLNNKHLIHLVQPANQHSECKQTISYHQCHWAEPCQYHSESNWSSRCPVTGRQKTDSLSSYVLSSWLQK